MKLTNRYLYLPKTKIVRELDRYDSVTTLLLIPSLISILGIIFILIFILFGDIQLSAISISILMILIIMAIFSFGTMQKMFRKIKLLTEAMLVKDIGIYVPTRYQRKKFSIKTKYIPFEGIKTVYPNGELWAASITAQNGMSTIISKQLLPNLNEFEEKWRDKILFIKDRCYLWFNKGRREHEFLIVNRIQLMEDRAHIDLVEGSKDLLFREISNIEIIPWKGKLTGAIVTHYSGVSIGYVTFKGIDLIDMKTKWKKYWKTSRKRKP